MPVNQLTFLNRKIVAPIHNKTITTVARTHLKTSKIINNTTRAAINSTITIVPEEAAVSNVVEVKATLNNADHTKVNSTLKTHLNQTRCHSQFRISIKDSIPKFKPNLPHCLPQCPNLILWSKFKCKHPKLCLCRQCRCQFPLKIYLSAILIIWEVYKLHKKESNMSVIDFIR